MSIHDIAVILGVIVAGVTIVASCLCHCFCLRILVPGIPVPGLPAINGVPGVVGVSTVPFEHAVAGTLLLLLMVILPLLVSLLILASQF